MRNHVCSWHEALNVSCSSLPAEVAYSTSTHPYCIQWSNQADRTLRWLWCWGRSRCRLCMLNRDARLHAPLLDHVTAGQRNRSRNRHRNCRRNQGVNSVAFLPAATLGAVRSTGAKSSVRPSVPLFHHLSHWLPGKCDSPGNVTVWLTYTLMHAFRKLDKG